MVKKTYYRKHVSIGERAIIMFTRAIAKIGYYVMFGLNVTIITSGH